MPIHVDIRINDENVRTVHIGREQDLVGKDEVHQYRITTGTVSTRADWWDPDSVTFEHKYSDGVEVCVARGLEALYGQQDS